MYSDDSEEDDRLSRNGSGSAKSVGDDGEIDEFGNVVRADNGRQQASPSIADTPAPSSSNKWALEAMDDVEILVEEEDTEPITQPIVKPIVIKKFSHHVSDDDNLSIPRTTFDFKFMHKTLMEQHDCIRNIAIIGNLLHGKSSLVDCLVEQTHPDFQANPEKPIRFTDTLYAEQERGISIKASPVSIVHQNLNSKSFLLNIMDTPGHVNFSDEVTASLRLCDGVVLVVDSVEGAGLMNTKRLIEHAINENMAITLCINKIDRLALELKFPPKDAYYKLKRIIDEVNELIFAMCNDESRLISPILGNVCFMSSQYSICFTLESFAKLYLQRSQSSLPGKYCDVSHREFAKKLWGTTYRVYDEKTSRYKFTSHKPDNESRLTFVEFILEPLYKLLRLVVEEPENRFLELANNYNIKLNKKQKKLNVRPLLKLACSQFFGPFNGFVEMVTKYISSPKYNAPTKCHHIWTGPSSCDLTSAISQCDPEGPLVMHVTKQFATQDATSFNVFGLVLSGTLRAGNDVRVLGETYSAFDNEEDSRVLPVNRLWIFNSRYNVEVRSIPAGNWALVEGIDQPIFKTATIIDFDHHEELYIFRPLKFNTKSVIKVAVEPVNPSELPKMLDGFRKCNKSYPLLQTKVEASGEHVIMGTGELYLDCVMHDLRHMYSEIEIRISDPGVCFSETVTELSSERCLGESPNEQYQFTMVAGPLDKNLDIDLEEGRIGMEDDQQYIDKFFKRRYNWDDLDCRSIWAFGPETNSTNLLMNETIEYEVRQDQLMKVKGPIVQAFNWTTREGPLCDEPMRGVKFRLQHAMIARDPIPSDVSQVISTTRKVSYLSFLKAEPRLMEPYLFFEIVAPPDVIKDAVDDRGRVMKSILEKIIVDERRGKILKRAEVPGCPLYRVTATIPAIDSFGFETDLRVRSTGQAFCQSIFHEWRILHEDPLNRDIDPYLVPLEPQRTEHLAREFLLKTRRRKGLSEDVNIEMFMIKPKQ